MEFCKHLSAFNKRDPLMIQQLIKYSVMELRSVLKKDVMEAGQLDSWEVFVGHPSCLGEKRNRPEAGARISKLASFL